MPAPEKCLVQTLLEFNINAVFDLVHGKADTFSIPFWVETDFSEWCVDELGSECLGNGVIVRGPGLLDGIAQRQGRRIGVEVECTGIFVVSLAMGVFGGNCQRILGYILGSGGINAFGVFTRDFDKGVILNTVIRDENGFHLLLAHLGYDLRGFGMVTPENHGLSLGTLYFLNNGRIIDRPGRNSFVESKLRPRVLFYKPFGKLGQAFAVIAFVMQDDKLSEL